MSWIAGAAAAAGGIMDAVNKNQAKQKQKGLLSKMNKLYRQNLMETESLYGQAYQQIMKGMMYGNQGYAQGRKDVSMSGAGSRQAVMDMMKQNLAEMKQQSISGGFGNSTVLSNLNRGVYADTQRNLLGVDSNIAGQLGGMSVNQGMMQQAAMQQLAQLLMAKAAAKNSGYQGWAGALGNVQHTASGGGNQDFSGIMKLFGGMFGGGGGGGSSSAGSGIGGMAGMF